MPTREPSKISLPPTLSPAQRKEMLDRFSALLRLLHGPKSSPEAKKSAGMALAEFGKQVEAIGGKVSLAGTMARSSPLGSPASSLVRSSALSGPPLAASHTPRPPTIPTVRSATPTAPSPALPAGVSGMKQMKPAPSAAPLPVPLARSSEAVTPPPDPPATEPLGPPEPPDLMQAAEKAGSDTPEMAMLKKMLLEKAPSMPSGDLTLGQKIAYGLLAGLVGLDKVVPLIQGQKAEAVQKFLMQRQEREALMKNLQQFVELQGAQASDQAGIEAKAAERSALLDSTASALFLESGKLSGTIATASSVLEDLGRSNRPDLRARYEDLSNQIVTLSGQNRALNEQFTQNPDSLTANTQPLDALRRGRETLEDSFNKTVDALAEQATADSLPDKTSEAITLLQGLKPHLLSAERQVTRGAGGPIEAYLMERPLFIGISEAFGSDAPTQFAMLQNTMSIITSTLNNMKDQGAGKTLTASELQLLGGMFLRSESWKSVSLARIRGLMAWIEVKTKVLSGDPNAQADADNILMDMEDAGD